MSSLGSALSSIGSYAQQAWDFAQAGVQGYQAAQQFAQSLGLGGQPAAGGPPAGGPAAPGAPPAAVGQPPAGPAPTDFSAIAAASTPVGMPAPAWTLAGPGAQPPSTDVSAAPQPQPSPIGAAPQLAGGVDQLSQLLQALTQRQIPPLPAPGAQPAMPSPMMASAPAQPDALGLLRLILTNPQLQQTLQSAPGITGAGLPRAMQLPIPAPSAPRYVRPVQLPLGAVMNAIYALSGQVMSELNEAFSEEEPEVPAYLVGDDGGFLVDPASSDDRAALVAHLFRVSDAAQRSGLYPQLNSQSGEADDELDECDRWARDAGFA